MSNESEYKDLEQLADLFIMYYKPIQMIEHKYKTKITAVGLLKSADFTSPSHLEPYYQRLKSYKGLIKDHTDNLKLASEIAIDILSNIIKNLFINFLQQGQKKDCRLMNQLISLMYPKYKDAGESIMVKLRKPFVLKYKSNRAIQFLAEFLLNKYLNEPRKYDMLGNMVVKKCLTGVTQEEVGKKIATAKYNFFIYGLYSRTEATNVYNITLKTKEGVQPMKYFTRVQALARAIINIVGDFQTSVNFFGELFETFESVKKLFEKNKNINVMFY
ncbi:MAG: hypothetical protein JXJ04_09555 [Spirochaetales bacterium]|nr:hypothetical protein [Spirochaetales bacterium]